MNAFTTVAKVFLMLFIGQKNYFFSKCLKKTRKSLRVIIVIKSMLTSFEYSILVPPKKVASTAGEVLIAPSF